MKSGQQWPAMNSWAGAAGASGEVVGRGQLKYAAVPDVTLHSYSVNTIIHSTVFVTNLASQGNRGKL